MSAIQSDTTVDKSTKKPWWRKNSLTKPIKPIQAPARLFGVALTESISYAYSLISYHDEATSKDCAGPIPSVIARCGHFLKDQGLYVEGIFRLSGSAKRINQLQQLFDSPETQYGITLSWDGFTVHDAANIMKRYLNHLPVPVIPTEYHERFLATLDNSRQSENDKIQAFQSLMDELPWPHQFLLHYLLDLLAVFDSANDINRMDTACLASVFAPGFMTQPETDVHINPVSYKEAQRVLTYLVEHQDQFRIPPHSDIPSASQEFPIRPSVSPNTITPSIAPTMTTGIHPLYSTTSTLGSKSLVQLPLAASCQDKADYSKSSVLLHHQGNAQSSTSVNAIPTSAQVRRSLSIPSTMPVNLISRSRQSSLPGARPDSTALPNASGPRRWKSIRTVHPNERQDHLTSIATQ